MLRDPRILDATLTEAERAALQRFVEGARRWFTGDLDRVVLFGSRARGDVREDSDIDVLLILRPGRPVGNEDRAWAARLATELALAGSEYVDLSPKLLGALEFEHLVQRERRFALDVQNEGIEL